MDEQIFTDPTLIVEVLSPSTRGYDKRDKFALYRLITSLREYALIDPATRQVEVFTLAEAGAWLFTDSDRGWHTQRFEPSIWCCRSNRYSRVLLLLTRRKAHEHERRPR